MILFLLSNTLLQYLIVTSLRETTACLNYRCSVTFLRCFYYDASGNVAPSRACTLLFTCFDLLSHQPHIYVYAGEILVHRIRTSWPMRKRARHHQPPSRCGADRKTETIIAGRSNAGDPCSCVSPLPDPFYYYCHMLLSARLCYYHYCVIYVAELLACVAVG